MASTNETKVTGIPVPAEGTPEFEKNESHGKKGDSISSDYIYFWYSGTAGVLE